ncbi:MAG TPA: tRNA preQ1(34) S-adenosylmethionine ribosyltransferase-isomerase QueA [Caulobacteraceae bacterium]|nr:tRNA preQ1(34) S-adenosylmethionine ribosyltransferase-isomerase QueA [Caulobacteraceae bacterium]
MDLALFDFDLPEDRIALRPTVPRDAARLLESRADGGLADLQVSDLPDRLRPGDALIFNDTRVIPARLRGLRVRGESRTAVEATLHRRLGPGTWSAFMRPGRRLAPGDRIIFGEASDRACLLTALEARVSDKGADGEVALDFELAGPDLDLAIADRGLMPLPPYIASRRPEDERDRADYQTLYARVDGSVAAPTAGLHFTPELMKRLERRGVSLHFVTLHVGAGTFLPIKTTDIAEHRLHAEWGTADASVVTALNAVRRAGGRLVCVGTTSLRLVESAADEDGRLRPWRGQTSIYITPGYRFRAADGLLTNFHLPRSSLYVLAAAFCGLERIRSVYAHAIAAGYRFYSYGDASLLWRA